MSHKLTYEASITNIGCLRKVCQARGLELKQGRVWIESQYEEGLCLTPPGWTKAVVVKEDGTILYDNYDGHWGDIKVLNEFMDAYHEELAISSCQEASCYLADRVVGEDGTIYLYMEDYR